MKKHLIAAAVAAAVAAPAMAQNVSLYGTLDGSVVRMRDGTATGLNTTAYVDGAIASSVWGMRGSEDLGGGMKAVFEVQGDVQTNNGGMNNNGLFRRAANVGVSGAFGEINLGLKINPLIATNSALMPVSGNSVSTLTSVAMNYSDFFTKNAVTYTLPTLINGLSAQIQHGFGNSLSTTQTGGSVTAASVSYVNGPFAIRAAGQNRKENGTSSSANARIAGADALLGGVLSNTIDGDSTAFVAGISYKVGDVTLAAAWLSNDEAANGTPAAKTKRDGSQVGIGYQFSPAWLLGGSLTRAEGSSLMNAQARYLLSKRTTAYVQYAVSDNGSRGVVNFQPYATNTSGLPAGNINNYATGTTSLKSTALGAGLIHSF